MTRTARRNIIVGAFVLGGLAVAFAIAIALGAGTFLKPALEVETYVDESVQGLSVGSPVKARGVPIGSVTKIGFVATEYEEVAISRNPAAASRLVLIRMRLNLDPFGVTSPGTLQEDLAKMVERGLRVRLASQGVTGQAYLEVDYITAERQRQLDITWTPRDPVIPSAPSVLSRLQETAETVLSKLAETNPGSVVSGLTQLIQELRDTNRAVQGLVAGPELHGAVTDTASALASVRRLADATATGIDQLLAELRDSAAKLDLVAGQLADATKGGELQRTLRNAEAVTRQLQQATQNLPGVSGDVERTVRRVDNLIASTQRDIAVTLDNLNAASTNLRELSENAKRYPSQVLFGAPPPREGAGRR